MGRRLAYLGTPELAVPPLEALVAAGHDVVMVVTRPDRRRGRGAATSPSPVRAAAERLGIPVAHDLDAAVDARPELGVVVAYGRIIPEHVLAAVPMVNLHFSLLPRWRGAAPVERALLAGDRETGVCVMEVAAGLDTGDVYASRRVAVDDADDLASLRDRLVHVGAQLLVETLAAPLPEPVPQAGDATYAEKVRPEELELRWDRPAGELARVVKLGRAWTTWRGRRLRVLAAAPVPALTGAAAPDGRAGDGSPPPGAPPGTLVGDTVVTAGGALRLAMVQPEGKAPLAAGTGLRGARPAPGERLSADGLA